MGTVWVRRTHPHKQQVARMCGGDVLTPLSGAAFVLERGTDKDVRSAFAAVREDDVRCKKEVVVR